MPSFQIKLAEHFDLPDVIEILEELNLDMEDLDEDDWMVALVKDEIVGIGRLRYFEDACELASVGVLEDYRNQGIGSGIAKALIEGADSDVVYTVTEIPDYFSRLGFAASDSYPESISKKLQRCQSELNCSAPAVMKIVLQ
ncbi:MAG: GNAT family N-acetyltransferase [Chitinophagaceae bacterium]